METLAPLWRRLAEADDSPFVTWDWHRAWRRHFGWSCEETPVFVWEGVAGDRCLVPMFSFDGVLEMAGFGICDFQDALADSTEAVCAAARVLCRLARRRDFVLRFSQLSERGRFLGPLLGAAAEAGMLADSTVVGPCPWLRIGGEDVEGVIAGFGKSTRKGIRRRLRKMEEGVGGRMRSVALPDRTFFEAAAALHRARHTRSIFDEEGFDGFLEEISRSREVGLVAFALETELGQLMAFEIGFERGGRYLSWIGGFDPAFAEYRPGISLQTLAMAELARRGTRIYDFLCGGEEYKFHFATDEYLVRSLTVQRATAWRVAVTGASRLERLARPPIKKLLRNAGLYRTKYRIDPLV